MAALLFTNSISIEQSRDLLAKPFVPCGLRAARPYRIGLVSRSAFALKLLYFRPTFDLEHIVRGSASCIVNLY